MELLSLILSGPLGLVFLLPHHGDLCFLSSPIQPGKSKSIRLRLPAKSRLSNPDKPLDTRQNIPAEVRTDDPDIPDSWKASFPARTSGTRIRRES